jgi:acyl-CoA oxidase
VTIATRYLHVRRQFGGATPEQENQVVEYPSVYMRIVPVIVNAYVFMLVGKQMLVDYNRMAAGLKDGNTAMLAG